MWKVVRNVVVIVVVCAALVGVFLSGGLFRYSSYVAERVVPIVMPVPEILDFEPEVNYTYKGSFDYTVKVTGIVRNVGASGNIRVTARVYFEGRDARPLEKSRVIYLFRKEEREVVFFFPEVTLDDDVGKCGLSAKAA